MYSTLLPRGFVNKYLKVIDNDYSKFKDKTIEIDGYVPHIQEWLLLLGLSVHLESIEDKEQFIQEAFDEFIIMPPVIETFDCCGGGEVK